MSIKEQLYGAVRDATDDIIERLEKIAKLLDDREYSRKEILLLVEELIEMI